MNKEYEPDQKIKNIISEECSDVHKELMKKINRIMDRYFCVSDDIIVLERRQAFEDLKTLLIMELALEKDLDDSLISLKPSSAFGKLFATIKRRISEDIGELSRKSITEYDVDKFSEVVVIIFRILKYLDIDTRGQLILKGHTVRIHNDIQSNILMLEFEDPEVSDYRDYKCTIDRIEDLKREFEYMNYFLMNYLDERARSAFKVSQIYFDQTTVRKNFIEGEVSFRSSVKIIEKLVGPLYLNKEKYGLRELLQNAIDACIKKKKDSQPEDAYRPCVKITYIRGEHPSLRIEDNGVGMNEITIINHFLTVGESSKTEKDGEGYIGKFGIGILSAFLLTDELEFNTVAKPSGPNGEQYEYCSENIKVESLRSENSPIHIRKTELSGLCETKTIIKLTLKKNLLNEINHTLAKKLNEVYPLYDRAFDRKRHWTGFDQFKNKLWNRVNEQVVRLDHLYKLLNFEVSLSTVNDVPSFLQKQSNTLEEILSILNSLSHFVEREDSQEELSLHNELLEVLKRLQNVLEELSYVDAVSCFSYLDANRWYIHDEVDVHFYCDDQFLDKYQNTSLKDYTIIESNEEKLDIKYKWIDDTDLQSKVLCNHILIPAKYEFKHYLNPAFKRLPLFSLIEKGRHKVNIDLSRERCELDIYEDTILTNLLSDTLQELLGGSKNLQESKRSEKISNNLGKHRFVCNKLNVHDVSFVYYKQNGKIHYSIKSSAIIKQLGREGFRMYRVIGVNSNQFAPTDKFEEYMQEGYIYEFAQLQQYIQTSLQDIEQNQLKICANNRVNLYLPCRGESSLENVLPPFTNWAKALLLASHNFEEVIVNASIVNQLKLNNNYLKDYINDSVFLSALERCKNKLLINNVIYLNYYNREESNDLEERLLNATGLLKSDKADIQMILEFHLGNDENVDTDSLFNTFRALSYRGNNLYNNLQGALRQMPESQDGRLRDLLLARYLYDTEIHTEVLYV
ncbi:Chaperone protein HtpG [compost metagenome]